MVASKYLPKWELTYNDPSKPNEEVFKKEYFSITDISRDYPELNRQVIYRIRKKLYNSVNTKAFAKYSHYSIKRLTGYKLVIHREIIRD